MRPPAAARKAEVGQRVGELLLHVVHVGRGLHVPVHQGQGGNATDDLPSCGLISEFRKVIDFTPSAERRDDNTQLDGQVCKQSSDLASGAKSVVV